VDTWRHHPRRPGIALFGAALALLVVACSSADDDSSTATTVPATTGSTATTDTLTNGDDDIALTLDVDGQSLYLECRGTGSPTVVLQSGFGNAGDIWSLSDTTSPAVFPAVAETNRVCIYDRPGSMITTTDTSGTVTLAEAAGAGRSGSAPMPRDPADVVTELHDLLAAADVPGPYVLVGHSLGGAFDLLFARTYPDDVAALVFVDSPLPPERELVGELWEAVQVMSQDPSLVPGYELESYDVGTLFDEIEAAGPLPDIPVVVIRRGDGAAFSDDNTVPEGAPFTQAEVDAINTAQWESQALWAAGVPGAEVITVDGTTHYVQNQRPDAVVDAIRSVIART
jgi:pimeloyl-ACP methyl ester carboxylesterase